MDFSQFNFPKNFQDFQQNITKIISSNTLKDLIRRIRACKTIQDERNLIQKESFEIRTAFKQEKEQYQNVEKLLYIHMLGYNSHFGQIECLKLAASPRFIDKRLAYLGTMLLLDENQETLTLLTNCLKNDLENSNIYIAGLALCVLGNIASTAMARDLVGEVEKLLKSPNTFVKKKACLTAIRIVRKNPDLKDYFVGAVELLNEKNHGVLLTCCTLLYELCNGDEEITELVIKKVPTLVKILRTLVSGGSSPEHDVNGICDPFLQVKILKLLRVCGRSSSSISEQVGDVLTLVCTATDSSKNVGSAILYEAVLTILNIQSDPSLRVLAVNLLGKFLQTNDNNIKYVALTTLNTAAQQQMTDSNSLQRHRSTIMDCLSDKDVTIRKCALELSFQLLNNTNVRILTRELLNYLELAGIDEKASVASKIVDYAGRYRPTKRWEIDTLARVLKLSGKYCDQMVVNEFVKCVTTSEEIQPYIVLKMFGMLADMQTHNESKLVIACLWCIGEYGDILVSGNSNITLDGEDDEEKIEKKTPSELEVLQVVFIVLDGPLANFEFVTYGLNCLVKLESRFRGADCKGKIQNKIASYKQRFDVEVQQRACEYSELIHANPASRKEILKRLPVLDIAVKEQAQKGTGTKAGNIH